MFWRSLFFKMKKPKKQVRSKKASEKHHIYRESYTTVGSMLYRPYLHITDMQYIFACLNKCLLPKYITIHREMWPIEKAHHTILSKVKNVTKRY